MFEGLNFVRCFRGLAILHENYVHFNGRHAQPRNELLLEAILQNLSASKIVCYKGHYFGGIY